MERIEEIRVVPVGVIESADDAVATAQALSDGGLPILEITLRTPQALEAIAAVREKFPDMLLGAGTILRPEQVVQARDAGAMFGVAPGINETVVGKAQELGMPFVPGVMTPTEVEKALVLGCTLQKFFPAQQIGGAATLKALAGPYAATGVKFIPLGGVKPDNARDYLQLPVVAAIGGSWLVDKKIIAEKNWDEVTRRARKAVALSSRH